MTQSGLGDRKFASYVVARKYGHLTGVLGIGDDANEGFRARLEVVADNKTIFQKDIAAGETVPIDLNITNVFRLTFSSTCLVASGFGYTIGGTAVFGDAKLSA